MVEIFKLFAWPLLAGTLLGVALSVVGVHLAGRSRTVQVLNSAQGAELGSLLVIFFGLTAGAEIESLSPLHSLLGAAGGALLFGFLSQFITSANQSSRTPLLLSLWIFLVAATQLSIALNPILEAHFSRMLLGDLTTLSNSESKWISVLTCAALLFIAKNHNSMLKRTFDSAIFRVKRALITGGEDVFILGLIALCTWAFGFLYTCAVLFIPTSLLSVGSLKNSARHFGTAACATFIAIPVGFMVSLTGQNIPTTPSVVVALFVVSFLALFVLDLKKRSN
jgi:ABC-type Mn2+/Zn2+ transport system permease subunit